MGMGQNEQEAHSEVPSGDTGNRWATTAWRAFGVGLMSGVWGLARVVIPPTYFNKPIDIIAVPLFHFTVMFLLYVAVSACYRVVRAVYQNRIRIAHVARGGVRIANGRVKRAVSRLESEGRD